MKSGAGKVERFRFLREVEASLGQETIVELRNGPGSAELMLQAVY